MLRSVQPASRLPGRSRGDSWAFGELAGTLSELSGCATTTLALRLAWQAQRQGEPVAWVTERRRCFFPPDAAANGLDLGAIAIARLPRPEDLGKAADTLVRSGAFGLVVIDLAGGRLPDRQLTRLFGLARKHRTAVLVLTARGESAPSLGSAVALRATTRVRRTQPGVFELESRALKDRHRPVGWRHTEVCRAPAGLR